MNSLQSMYTEYVKSYTISKEVLAAFTLRRAGINDIIRAKEARDKYYALSVLVFNIMRTNNATI